MKALNKGLLSIAIASLVISGCGNTNGSHTSNGDKLKIVATFYPMVEFTKQVAGDHAEVVGLIPSGAEPHDWEPSPKDVAAIQKADVFVYNGIVESWVEKTLASAINDKRVDVEASKGIVLMEGVGEHEHEHDHEHDHDHEHAEGDVDHDEDGHEAEHSLDPHVWLDPSLAQQEVRNIQAALEQADPDHKDEYKANADAYVAKLKALDEKFREDLKDSKRKEFVTQHAAFGYLARTYGLIQIPIAGLSPEQEPSPEKMAEVIKLAKEHDVRTIFFETLVDPKIAKTIAEEIGASTDVLNPLEGLTEEEVSKGLDYIGIMTNNLAGLIKALNK
ncbi:metal ABC transporter substrate-binding protein [Cohnella abietis]|uniref:High-affinity zinc uptake system binding-protein ZnuA n=1 Tax=Cohnella abietis TaxID=2507935 RepID=A0A3T1DCG5_9BACL|nr:metal ABC transporter substrate-binding protein [Cohnella abietis]BBI35724.1 high-affinity zinc uptake system binding-protein ZnuA [Cohnella abietis]